MLVFELASMMVDYDTFHEQCMVCFLVYRGRAAFSSALVVPHDDVDRPTQSCAYIFACAQDKTLKVDHKALHDTCRRNVSCHPVAPTRVWSRTLYGEVRTVGSTQSGQFRACSSLTCSSLLTCRCSLQKKKNDERHPLSFAPSPRSCLAFGYSLGLVTMPLIASLATTEVVSYCVARS